MRATFLKDLRLFLRDATAPLLVLLAPIAMITVITLARHQSADPPRPLIPVVDHDEGPVAGTFIELLGEHADARRMEAAAAEREVRDLGQAPAAIVFPAGLSKRYLQGRPSTITILTDPAQALALTRVRALLVLMARDAAELADPLTEALLVYREQNVAGRQLSPKSREQNVPGFTLMFVLLAVVFGTASALHDERGWSTLSRLLVAPVGLTRILGGKLAMRIVVGTAQAAVLLLWGRLVFGISLGPSALAIVVLLVATVFAAAALGLLLAAVSSTRAQALPLSLAVTLGLAALCGLWWPLSLVPDQLRLAGEFLFPTWAMYGLTDLVLRDRGVEAVAIPVGVALGQGAVLLAVGLWGFRVRYARR